MKAEKSANTLNKLHKKCEHILFEMCVCVHDSLVVCSMKNAFD